MHMLISLLVACGGGAFKYDTNYRFAFIGKKKQILYVAQQVTQAGTIWLAGSWLGL
jgi:hypothetical protein